LRNVPVTTRTALGSCKTQRPTAASPPAIALRLTPVTGTLYITGDAAADELLNNDPLALLLGMLLDQHIQ
jgi:hypothetical protein